MKPTKKSNIRQLLGFIIPSQLDFIMYIFCSASLLAVLNTSRFWAAINEGVMTSVGSDNNPFKVSLQTITDSRLVGNILVLLFWCFVGSVVYMIVWVTQNSLTEVKREVGSGQMISGDLKKHNYLPTLLAHFLFFIALTFVLLTILVGGIFVLIPASQVIFYDFIVNFKELMYKDMLFGLGSVLLISAWLYSLIKLLQIYTRFWRLYIKSA